jgi:hypothetical protein
MARYKAITSKNRNRTTAQKRRRICALVDGIYVLLLIAGILIGGINQFNLIVVGCDLIVMGLISVPAAIFHIYITKNGWSRSALYTNNEPEVKIATAIEIIFLTGCSVVLPILGVLRLLGLL